MGAGSKLYYPDRNLDLYAFRGYFQLKGISEVREFQLNFDDETTGLSSIHSLNSEGSSYWYTLDGRKLSGKPTQKGIYINNGIKRVIK